MDAVFRALADPSRRRLLDALNARGAQTLRELCGELDMTRQAVTKHLAVLEAAGLVTTARRGRAKLHHLNAAPINDIADRWINRYGRERVRALADLKRAMEGEMTDTEFVYVTYIRTTPEKLWQALTEPAFTRLYWGVGLKSDWRAGSPVRAQNGTFSRDGWQPAKPDDEFRDWGQQVLESDPPRRLSYTWHTYQPDMAEMFGWSDEKLAELQKEKRSKVTFELEPEGDLVKLTLIHDDFEPGSEMLKGVRDGWPAIMSSLKSLLETGRPANGQDEVAASARS